MNGHLQWLLSGRKHVMNNATLRGRTLLPSLYAFVPLSEIMCVLFRPHRDIQRKSGSLPLPCEEWDRLIPEPDQAPLIPETSHYL